MEQLSAMDAAFLYIETDTLPQHVLGIMLLDAEGSQGRFTAERFREVTEQRLHLMPAFTRRLAQVPLNLDHPYWVPQDDVDLDEHISVLRCPEPGDLRALGDLVGELGSVPLPRDRPLWQLWLVEGVQGGQVALVAKLHHSTLYGAAGADMMAQLLDLEPEPRTVEPPDDEPAGEVMPSTVSLLGRAAVNGARRPLTGARNLLGAARRTAAVGGHVARAAVSRSAVAMPFSAPRTPLNGRLTARRQAAFTTVAFSDVLEVKRAFDVKVNDVVLAAVTASLRDYLLTHGGLPTRSMVASVPMNLGAGAVEGTDRITAFMVPLPVQTADPVQQLQEVAEATRDSKGMTDALGPETVGDVAELIPPLLMVGGSKLYDGLGLSRLHPPLQSVVVSNMPGPPIPLYLAGARVNAVYPFGPLLPGSGLNVTVLSNMGDLDVGMFGCPDLVPELWYLADAFPKAVAELLTAARSLSDRDVQPG
ncbi:MAG: WS/DGAT/MGAT family O-acyltransferase [Actinomycetes bacterium]